MSVQPTTTAEPSVETTADNTVPRRRRSRWRVVLGAGAAVVVAGVAASAALGVIGGEDGGTPAATNLPPATAEVTRTTLVATEDFDGALGYGDPVTVSAGGSGVVTWLPAIGKTISRGEPVFTTNLDPVVLMYGSTPFFRPLSEGDSGADVKQLEENLAKLDHDGFTVDDEYTSATADVVSQWQDDAGLEETGQFDPAFAVVAEGKIRVADHQAALGDPAGGPVLAYTSPNQVITVDLEVADQQLVSEDMATTVTLPDGSTVDATVTSVGTVVTGGDTESEAEGQQEEETTIEVEVTVDDSDALDGWDAAPVDVTIEVDRREDALAVPVGALVALSEGGYGVQVVEGDQTRYVAVETGLFADGLVEITSDEVTEGMVVGVPS